MTLSSLYTSWKHFPETSVFKCVGVSTWNQHFSYPLEAVSDFFMLCHLESFWRKRFWRKCEYIKFRKFNQLNSIKFANSWKRAAGKNYSMCNIKRAIKVQLSWEVEGLTINCGKGWAILFFFRKRWGSTVLWKLNLKQYFIPSQSIFICTTVFVKSHMSSRRLKDFKILSNIQIIQVYIIKVLQYDETKYMFKRWCEFVHRFTDYKFEIFIYEDKFLWNWFEWSSSYDIYYSQNNNWKVWTGEIDIPQF